MKLLSHLCRLCTILSAFLLATLAAHAQTGLVISQIYGGGGNASAAFNADFVELYNPTNVAIDTTGLTIQYASATGAFSGVAPLTAASIQPGQYFLVQTTAAAATGASLPTPDTTATAPNLSATAGKVALVNGTTLLSADNTCALILADSRILDLVGFGATASCYPGFGTTTGPAPGPNGTSAVNNGTSILRTVSTVNTGNNAADFSLLDPPTPRNSSFSATPVALAAIGSANPATLIAGTVTKLTVTVSSPSAPANANVTVTGDLTLIGGIAAQAFTNNGDGTFTFSPTVATATSGTLSLPVSVTDGLGNNVSANIALTVNQPAPVVAIHDIQGVKSLTAEVLSPYAGKAVQTTGIVTAIAKTGFVIQSASPDGNPLTPEGIFVYTGSVAVPSSVAIGNLMQVTGTASTFPTYFATNPTSTTTSHTPSTELEAPLTITQLSTGNPLPAPIVLTAANLSPTGSIYQLTPYEGMRVSFASLTSISGTDGSLNETTETQTSNGEFYAVITGTPRPFREPGIDLRDAVVDPTKQPAVFDDNPERIFIDSGFLIGATPIDVSAGAVLPNVTGVLDFSDSYDDNYVPARLLIDPAYTVANITLGIVPQPVPATPAGQFTVASFNIERFYNTSSADDLYYVPAGVKGFNGSSSTGIVSTGQTFVSEAVDITQAAYTRRLQKLSLAIRNVLNTPDIVTLEEVENQSVANDIATQINTDAGIPNLYTAYSTDNTTYYTQDGTGISVGFLVKNSTVDKLNFTQYGQLHTYTLPGSSTPITLNDRPWLVLSAGIKRSGAQDYPVTVIVNHMKSLINVNSTTSASTRMKKELQAEDIAGYIQTLQAAGQHVISGGDFNAFEFSDGYTDTLATYTNTNVLPANQVVQPGVPGLVTPPLTDLALLLPPDQRQSYNEYGSAQILDHMVVTPELVAAGAHLVYAHLNADFPLTAYNNATTPARVSDHDAAVGYFTLPATAASATLTPATAAFPTTVIGVASNGQTFVVTNTGETTLTVTSIAAAAPFTASNNCTTLAPAATCTINVLFTPTAAGVQTGLLSVVTSASTTALTATLTGTGAPIPDFTLGTSAGSTTASVTVAAGSTATVPLVFTPNSTFNGTVALACTIAQGTNAPGVTCNVPATVALSGSALTQNVTFTTTSRTAAASGLALVSGTKPWIATTILALSAMLMFFASRSRRLGRFTVRATGLFALLLAVLIPVVGCSHSTPPATTTTTTGTTTNPNGTPAGAYIYTLTATSGTNVHAETITVTVQ